MIALVSFSGDVTLGGGYITPAISDGRWVVIYRKHWNRSGMVHWERGMAQPEPLVQPIWDYGYSTQKC